MDLSAFMRFYLIIPASSLYDDKTKKKKKKKDELRIEIWN